MFGGLTAMLHIAFFHILHTSLSSITVTFKIIKQVSTMKNDSIQVSDNISPKTLTKQLVEFQKSSDFQIHMGFFLDLLLGFEFSSFEDIPTYPITSFTKKSCAKQQLLEIDNPNIETQVFEEHNGIFWNNKYQIDEVYKTFSNQDIFVAIVKLYTYDVKAVYKKAIIVAEKNNQVDNNNLLKILLGMECKNYYFHNIHFYEPVKSVFGYTYIQEKQIKQYHEHTDRFITQLIQDKIHLRNSYLYLPNLLDSLINSEYQYLKFYQDMSNKI